LPSWRSTWGGCLVAIRTRKDERERIIALLEDDHPSADKLADAVLKTSYELLQQREWWVFGATLDTLTLPYGFYSSSADAVKAATQLGGPIAGFVKILPASRLPEIMAALDKNFRPLCDCRHPWDIHVDGGNKPGCPTKGCDCQNRHS
jgi:hypothetical protein